ncbi:hypothetical protein M5K25_027123 [Dendrobium thyrsiflorum]|uniref:Uncharacterized protein n=1 Tax=Dendrobium thyrsiflorum TaxID=117978 RepID=A0ABD0TZ58_DENTH
MRLFGKHVFPRQIVLLASGSIKYNEKPPTKEQIDALQSYLDSKRPVPPNREKF